MLKKIITILSIVLLLILSGIINSCSGTIEIPYNSVEQKPCFDEKTLLNIENFPGILVDSLSASQSQNLISVSMIIKTYCGAQMTFNIEKNEDRINLHLYNANHETDNCVCPRKLSVSFNKTEPGFYNLILTNLSGTQLFGQLGININ